MNKVLQHSMYMREPSLSQKWGVIGISVVLFLAWSLLGVSFGAIGLIGTPLEDIPRSIEVSATLTTLSFGETTQLTVIRTLRDGSMEDITSPGTGTTYRSVDPSIATVEANGLVVANAPGQTTIFVTTSTGHSAFLFLRSYQQIQIKMDSPTISRCSMGLIPMTPQMRVKMLI